MNDQAPSVLTSFRAHPLMHTTGFLLATIPVVVLMPTRSIAPADSARLAPLLMAEQLIEPFRAQA